MHLHRHTRHILRLLCTAAILIALGHPAQAGFLRGLFRQEKSQAVSTDNATIQRTVHHGNPRDAVRYDFFHARLGEKEVPIHVVRVDLNNTRLESRIVLAEEKFGKAHRLSQIARKHKALAAINGAFFSTRTRHPVGYLILDGRPLKAPLAMKERTTFGIMKDGRIQIGKPRFRRRIRPEKEYFSMVDDINKTPGDWEIVMLTREYGPAAEISTDGIGFTLSENGVVLETHPAGLAPIPEEGYLLAVGGIYKKNFMKTVPGDHITLTQTLMEPWEDIREGFGSVVSLLQGGRASFDPEAESVTAASGLRGRAPRSLAGITADNQLLLVATDGRSTGFRGITLDESIVLMKELGARDAVSLDGGGSTTLWYRDHVVNSPDGGRERPIATALLVVPRH